MNNYEIVFQKVTELTETDRQPEGVDASSAELDQLEELRRFTAELREAVEPISLTSTI